MTLCDVAVGAHLGNMEESLGRGDKDRGSSVKHRTQFSNGEGAQDTDTSQGFSKRPCVGSRRTRLGTLAPQSLLEDGSQATASFTTSM